MASIQSITFDQASYNPGDTITLTVDYTADSASTPTPQTFTATVVITNSGGSQTATQSAPFVINIPGTGGDVVSVTDDDNHTWAEQSDSGSVAVFTTTA
jgi:hypothetical protein